MLKAERTAEVLQAGMPHVLLGEDGMLGGNAPVDDQLLVEDADAVVGLGMIELVTLILEDGRFREHGKAMGKALGNEELTMIVLRQLHADVLAIGGAALADVDHHVEHRPLDTPHQLALRERRALEVQSAHHAVARLALVVLHKGDVSNLLVELSLREALEKISSGILKQARLKDEHAVDGCFDYVHSFLFFFGCKGTEKSLQNQRK